MLDHCEHGLSGLRQFVVGLAWVRVNLQSDKVARLPEPLGLEQRMLVMEEWVLLTGKRFQSPIGDGGIATMCGETNGVEQGLVGFP